MVILFIVWKSHLKHQKDFVQFLLLTDHSVLKKIKNKVKKKKKKKKLKVRKKK